jgi:hypothetical protein
MGVGWAIRVGQHSGGWLSSSSDSGCAFYDNCSAAFHERENNT